MNQWDSTGSVPPFLARLKPSLPPTPNTPPPPPQTHTPTPTHSLTAINVTAVNQRCPVISHEIKTRGKRPCNCLIDTPEQDVCGGQVRLRRTTLSRSHLPSAMILAAFEATVLSPLSQGTLVLSVPSTSSVNLTVTCQSLCPNLTVTCQQSVPT